MKKFFLFATVACLALASCDDVAEPFEIVTPGKGGTSGSSSSLPYTNANLKDWNLVTIKGAAWSLGSSYAKVTGHSGGADGTTTETESWLVSPAISLVTDSADVHITMDHVIRYVNATTAPLSNHTMWITTDYSNDVATATWTQLEYKPVESSTNDWTFYAADPIAVPSEFVGKEVYIAFKFICGASSTTWEINNLKVVAGKAVSVTPPTPDPAEHISIADFIAKADANTVYEITGVASKLNANYASLDLTEGDATVYVYKMVDASGAKVDFTALNIAEGDTVTVTGKYYKYEKDGNVKHELNPGTYVSHKKAGSVTPPTPTPAEHISIADFIAKADANTVYEITGVASKLNANYASLDLTEGDATVYVYKMVDASGAKVDFTALDIAEGDTITITGKYYKYEKDGNVKHELNPGTYVSHKKAVSVTPPTPTPAEHISIADFIAKADANTVYEITGVASKLNANYASLDLTEGDATVYVYKMVDASGAKVDFTALNIAEGDTVTVTGKYYKYEKDGNVKHELNPGTYVSHKKAGSVTPPTPGPVETISVAEFLSKADPNTTYRLVGTVKNIANATYGNFDLVQDGASIYIYGLLDKDGAAKNFASLGIKEGDELTLEGKYVDYNGKAEIKNAQYISHVSAGGGDPTPDPNPNPDPDPQPSGDNLIANGDFETWADGVPTNWKTASTAGNATIKQSTVAHSGKYSVEVAGTTSTNKRLGYKETNFAAGTYVVKFWVKAASDACSVRPGYATFNADGTINSSGYKYGDYVNDVTSAEWKEVTYEFTLESAQQICPVIMVSKNPGTSALIDDYSITKK